MKNTELFLFKQKKAYVLRISDWSSDVCSSDLYRHDTVGQRDARRLGPAATANLAVDMETVPRQPVDIGHGEIGDFLAKDARGVGGRKAKPPGRRKVDIIDADAPFDDSFQPSRLAPFTHACTRRIVADDPSS